MNKCYSNILINFQFCFLDPLDLNWDIINGHFTSHSRAQSALQRITVEASVLTPHTPRSREGPSFEISKRAIGPSNPHFARIFAKSNDWWKDQDDSLLLQLE